MVSSGKVITRPHSKLNLEDPAVAALPAHLKLEYQHVEEEERSTDDIVQQATSTDSSKPKEEDMEEAKEPDAMPEMKKALRTFSLADPDITARLAKFESDALVSPNILTEASKALKECKKIAKQLQAHIVQED